MWVPRTNGGFSEPAETAPPALSDGHQPGIPSALCYFLLIPEQHLTAVYVLYLRSRDRIWHELGSKGLGKTSFLCFVMYVFIGSVMITRSMVIYFGNFHRHQLRLWAQGADGHADHNEGCLSQARQVAGRLPKGRQGCCRSCCEGLATLFHRIVS